MNRRKFIELSVAWAAVSAAAASCTGRKKIRGGMVGASATVGHMLRDQDFSRPVELIHKDIVIVGAGVSGLAAARHLHRQGVNDFLVFDLEKGAGGNSRSGLNDVSAYPWGAHYIPTPNNDLGEYLEFLEECDVITGRDAKGLPVYNEAFLCFDSQERLYINGRWQDGIIPHFGVPAGEKQQIAHFLQLMEVYRYQKGSDGKDAFAIPVDASSQDEAFKKLDDTTMKKWLLEKGFSSTYLHWYVDYCTRDDFGTRHEDISAWMGIHYFASRKGRGANADHSDVLTWPEGNGFLVKNLMREMQDRLRTDCLVVKVEAVDDGVRVVYFDVTQRKVKDVQATQCILAVPQFIAARLLGNQDRIEKVQQQVQYTPWMVANLKVGKLLERSGAPPSWDNVLYGSASLGYVEATHELLQQQVAKKNLTYYLPLTQRSASEERKAAQQKTYDQWVSLIKEDLRKVHPNLEEVLEEVNIMIWGHAMAQPLPGWVHGTVRKELADSGHEAIHFAHTDLAGASLFEEAFYQGLKAGKQVIAKKQRHV